jgi:hypothetical protein
MTLSGAEHPAKSSEKSHLRGRGGAESGVLARIVHEPDLCRILAAWPTLPEPIRRAVLALIGAAAEPPA